MSTLTVFKQQERFNYDRPFDHIDTLGGFEHLLVHKRTNTVIAGATGSYAALFNEFKQTDGNQDKSETDYSWLPGPKLWQEIYETSDKAPLQVFAHQNTFLLTAPPKERALEFAQYEYLLVHRESKLVVAGAVSKREGLFGDYQQAVLRDRSPTQSDREVPLSDNPQERDYMWVPGPKFWAQAATAQPSRAVGAIR